MQPLIQLVCGLGLDPRRQDPCLEEVGAAWVGEFEEVMVRRLPHRFGTGYGGIGVDQVGRLVGRAASLAVVAVLVTGVALRALTLDEPVRQEHFLHRVVILLDGTNFDQPGFSQVRVDAVGVLPGFRRMGGIVVIEFDMETVEVALVLLPDAGDELFRGDPFLLRTQHDRRAMGVVGAAIDAVMAAHLLKAYPDVGLDVFDQMAQVDGAVGVGQG